MKTFKLFLILIYFNCLYSFGQFRPMENYPSPNAASLGTFGNTPVSLYTGNPQISIPLYNVVEGDISLPISLNYHLASVKPNQRSGWVGLGWNLIAGGCITRNVRGIPDEQKYKDGTEVGFQYNYAKLAPVKDINSLVSHEDHISPWEHESYEPYELTTDEYNFNFGEYSGSFYRDETGAWVVVSDHDIKVSSGSTISLDNLRSEIDTKNWLRKNYNDRFYNGFTLITPDGFSYKFGGTYATEYSISYYNRNNSDLIATSWFLTEITSPKGYSVTLEYEAGKPTCEIQYAAFSSYSTTNFNVGGGWLSPENIISSTDNTYGRSRLSGYLIFPVYLKSIKTTYATVNFHSQNDRGQEPRPNPGLMAWSTTEADGTRSAFTLGVFYPKNQFGVFMPSNEVNKIQEEYIDWRYLKGISIDYVSSGLGSGLNENVHFSKTFYFDYEINSRRKLKSLKEVVGTYYDVIPSSMPKGKIYQFEYNNEETFTRYTYAKTDHWGYFKGGESLLSDRVEFNEQYYSSREPTSILTTAQAETLKSIIFPTGGKTVFTYKLNKYSKIVPVSPSGNLESKTGTAGGLCISEIADYDKNGELVQKKKYYYTATKPSSGSSTYTTSGILKAPKTYMTHYSITSSISSIYMTLATEGGFIISGLNQNDPHISYSAVIEEIFNGENVSQGYTRYRYSNYDEDIWGMTHRDEKALYTNCVGEHYHHPISSRSLERGKLLSAESFNTDGKMVQSRKYKYGIINDGFMKAPYQERIAFPNEQTEFAFISTMTNLYTGRYFVKNETETFYNPNTGAEMQVIEKEYDYNRNKLLMSEIIHKNAKEKLETRYHYTGDYVNRYLADMEKCDLSYQTRVQSAHLGYQNNYQQCQGRPEQESCEKNAKSLLDMLLTQAQEDYNLCKGSISYLYNEEIFYDLEDQQGLRTRSIENNRLLNYPLTTTQILHKEGSSEIINGELFFYFSKGKNVLPYRRLAFSSTERGDSSDGYFIGFDWEEYDDRFKPEEYYKFDEKHNICEIKSKDGSVISYLWSYKGQCPVAEVQNVSYEELEDFLGTEFISSLLTVNPSQSQLDKINSLREQFSQALVNTYTHAPHIGRLTETDTRGVSSYYEYDNLGRLQEIYYFENGNTNNKRVIKSYEYNYSVK